VLDNPADGLRCRVAPIERRVARVTALLRFPFTPLRLLHPDLSSLHVPCGGDEARRVRAIDGARRVLGL